MKASTKNRKELKKKMAKALSNKIKPLTTELQDILVDDLVTAFESRLAILDLEESNLQCFVDEGEKVINKSLSLKSKSMALQH